MYNLTDRVNLLKQLGLIKDDEGYLKPVEGVSLMVATNSYKLLVGTGISAIFKDVGGWWFTVGNDCYKLRSDNFVVKHDDDYLNLDLGLFAQSKIIKQTGYHALA